MAFSASTRNLLLLVCILFSSCKFGRAYDYPQLGAAGVVANEFVPQAEGEEGDTDEEYYPHEPGVVGTYPGHEPGEVGNNPGPIFAKALECFHDKNIYSSCEEAYRLTQHGELNVPPEYTDEFCHGACLKETHLVLECIDEVLKHFVFYNKATVKDVKETLKTGCSYGPKRGDFNVAEHIQAEEDIASKISSSVLYGLVGIVMAWHGFF